MVMRCVFKHHVYLCVVSTALMAGLSLITSHTSKAYADQNCGSSRGGGVKVVGDVVGPIVCDSRETRTLNSRSGGDIEINMDRGRGSKEAAVTVTGQGTNITIMKKLKITGTGKASVMGMGKTMTVTKGGGIQMDGTGTADVMGLTIMGSGGMGVDMQGTGTMELNKVNVSGFTMGVNAMSGKVNINGNSTITVTNSGTVILNGVAISGFGKGVYATGAGTLTISGGTTIQFTGGSGNYGVKVENGVTANITGATIRGTSGQGTGVIKDGTKMMTMTDVTISGVKVGVEVKKGTVDMMGGTVTFEGGSGYGVQVQNGATANLTKVTIKGTGSGQGTGVDVQNGTMTLTGVGISGVQKGVDMTAGKLVINMGSIGFKGERGNYGVKASGEATAELTKVTITGEGSGKGVIMESSGKMTMNMVNISQVQTGVDVKNGTVDINMGEITFEGGRGNYGVHVQKAATANLMNVKIKGTGSGQGTGLYVQGTGSASMMGGTISNVSEGVLMTGSGTLKISGEAKIMFKGDYGVKVMGTATANITGATIKGEGSGVGSKGVIMESTGKLTINGGTIKDVAMGVEVTSGNLTVSGGSMTGVQTGIIMLGSGTLTVNSGARITVKNGGTGLSVGGTATANITGATITGSGSGKGTGVWMDGREMVMNNVQISDVAMGVEAIKGNLTIKDGTRITFTGGDRNYGVKVGELVTNARLTDLTIKGGGKGKGVIKDGTGEMKMNNVGISGVQTGIQVSNGNLTVSGGTMTGVQTGIDMSGSGKLVVNSGARIEFTGEHGVKVGSEVTMATITGTEITGGGQGTGVWMEGKTLKMEKVTISNVAMGVEATNGTLTMTRGSIEFKNGRDNYGIGVGKSVTLATITGTKITGEGKGTGVLMMETKMMRLDGVTISNVGEGVWVKGRLEMNNGSITVTNSGFKGYGVGVYVGKEATATLKGTRITGAGMGSKGVVMNGKTLGMSGVNISNVSEGVEVMGGILAMKGGSIGFIGDYGISLNQGGFAFLGGVNIMGSGTGKEGIKLNGGMIDMFGTNIRDVHKGMSVENGVVRMFGGEIGFKGNYGVYLKKGGAALIAVTIKGNRTGQEGIKLNEGIIDLYKTNIRDVHKGMSVENGVVRMFGGEIGFKKDYGISLKQGGVALKNVRITGPSNKGTGVIMQNGVGVMMMKEVDISKVQTGVWVINGKLMMHKGSVEFKGGDGISLIGGNAALKDVNITGQGYETEVAVKAIMGTVAIKGGEMSKVGTGVEVGSEGTVIMKEVDISKVTTGVKVKSEGAVWLIDTNLRDVHKGVSVEDGVVHMEGGEIGFMGERGVSLTGGQALLDDVRITGPSDKGTGVYATGMGTLMMKEVKISEVQTGVWMKNGNLTMTGGTIGFNGDYGVSLTRGNALLKGVSITGQDDKGTGVNVEGEGKMMMKDVNISGVITGVWVKNGANAILMGGEIGFKGNYGVYLDKGGAALKNVRMTYTGNNKTADFIKVKGGIVIAEDIIITSTTDNGQGVSVTNGGRVWLTGTNLKGVHKGMTITDGSVRMEGGEINFKGEYGVYLNQGGVALIAVKMTYTGNNNEAEFIRIVGEDTTNAVEKTGKVQKNAVVVASHLTIDGNGHGQGMSVVDGGRVVLIRPNYTNIYNGMAITKGAVYMEGGEINFKGDYAVYLKKGHAVLNGVIMTYTGNDPDSTFLTVYGAGNAKNLAEIRGRGIRINGNEKAHGIRVIDGGMVVLDDAIFNKMSNGVTVTNGGRVVLENAIFSKVKSGITVINGEFSMKKGWMTFNGEHGISLHTGYALLKDVKMIYTGSKATKNAQATNFIKVKGKGANFAAIKVMVIGNNKTQGVHVTDGGYVMLDYSHITGVKEAITIQDGSLWMKNGVINFGGEYGLKMKGGRVLLSNVQMNSTSNNNTEFIMVEEKSAKLKAVGVIINGNDTGKAQGIKIANGGRAWLIGTNVKKVSTGVAVQNAQVTMISSSVNFTEDYGVNLTRVVL
ncbi:beta strand repeat-containing protein [Bartonella bovis]|nr:hypothetical protein [Bartonella bovis]